MATNEPDWGTDLDWSDDLEPNALLCSGTKLLGQAAFHAITTPRGACLDSPDRGIDIRDFLHHGMTPEERAEVPGLIRQELVDDERINEVEVSFTESFDGSGGIQWEFRILITPNTAGPFELVCAIEDAVPQILAIKPAA
jgi:hypothetical protein